MKKALLFFLGLVSALSSFSQNHIYNTSASCAVYGSATDEFDNTLILADRNDNIVLMKTNANGSLVWTKEFDFNVDQGFYGPSLAIKDSIYLLGGFVLGTGTTSRDGFLIWTDTSGNVLHNKRIDISSNSNAIHSISATDDGFIISGRADNGTGNSYDMCLMKADLAGNIVWSKTYGSNDWDWGRWAAQTNDGGYAIAGYADGFAGVSTDGYFVKTDSIGNIEFDAYLTSTSADELEYFTQAPEGHYFIGGYSLGMGSGLSFIMRVDTNAVPVWTKVFNGLISIKQLEVDTDGGLIFLADAQNISGGYGNYDIVVGKLSAAGVVQWSKVIGTSGIESAAGMHKLSNGNWTVIGNTTAYGLSSSQPFVFVLDSNHNAQCGSKGITLSVSSYSPTIATVTSFESSGYSNNIFALNSGSLSVTEFNPCCLVSPVASFNYNVNTSISMFNFSFNSTSSGTNNLLWDFGDGTTGTGANTTHTYPDTGWYQVCLSAIGACDTDSICQMVHVFCDQMVEAITQIEKDTVDTVYTFHFTSSSLPGSSKFWTFGDGDTLFSYGGTHTYDNLGAYQVCYHNYSYCDTAISCDSIIIECLPVSASISEVHVINAYFFESNATNASAFIWDFGDGTPNSYEANPVHLFPWINLSHTLCPYTVKLMTFNFCDTLIDSMLICFPGGISDISSDVLTITPNPATSVIQFKSDFPFQIKNMINLQGQIMELQVDLSSSNYNSLNVSQLPNGIYFIEFEINGIVKNQPFVVQHE